MIDSADEEWPERVMRQRLPTLRVEEVAEGIFWAQSFANAGWVVTDDGIVLIDTAGGIGSAALREELRRRTDLPVRYLIYTHGHEDHVVGAHLLTDEGTRVIAHEMVPERLRKYELLREHTNRINSLQFHIDFSALRPAYRYPDVTYHDSYDFELGGRRFQLFHGRGETDDATVIHIPDAGVVFSGDFVINVFPNVGNPFKVVRFEREWFETLERILQLAPTALVPGHGLSLLQGPRVREALQHNIEALRFLHQEVSRRLNEGQGLDRMVSEVRLPPHLAQSPHLRQLYSRVEFAVITIHRRYAGWYDGDPADLIPTPRRETACILRELIGDDERIVARARALWQDGQPLQAIAVLQTLLRAEEGHVEGRKLRLAIMEELSAADRCLMSRSVWLHFAELDRGFLSGQP